MFLKKVYGSNIYFLKIKIIVFILTACLNLQIKNKNFFFYTNKCAGISSKGCQYFIADTNIIEPPVENYRRCAALIYFY